MNVQVKAHKRKGKVVKAHTRKSKVSLIGSYKGYSKDFKDSLKDSVRIMQENKKRSGSNIEARKELSEMSKSGFRPGRGTMREVLRTKKRLGFK